MPNELVRVRCLCGRVHRVPIMGSTPCRCGVKLWTDLGDKGGIQPHATAPDKGLNIRLIKYKKPVLLGLSK